jgi:hypothetical protein
MLLACADADALFTAVHDGDFGKNSDGSVFRASTLGEKLEKKQLHISIPISLSLDDSGETFPYYFVADEAFPLQINLMRPYPRRMLTNKRRARKCVEYAFGILNAKFKILQGSICRKEETGNSIIEASLVLHNFIRTQEWLLCEGAKNYAVNQSSYFTR